MPKIAATGKELPEDGELPEGAVTGIELLEGAADGAGGASVKLGVPVEDTSLAELISLAVERPVAVGGARYETRNVNETSARNELHGLIA